MNDRDAIALIFTFALLVGCIVGIWLGYFIAEPPVQGTAYSAPPQPTKPIKWGPDAVFCTSGCTIVSDSKEPK